MGIRRALVWFRRDLRLLDHEPLRTALAEAEEVFACFVFDPAILDPLPRDDRRVSFIQQSLSELAEAWRVASPHGQAQFLVLYAWPETAIPSLAASLGVAKVFAGRDYEPNAIARDEVVARELAEAGRRLVLLKDQVVWESDEVLTQAGQPFAVFTPYANAWKKRLNERPLAPNTPTLARERLAKLPEHWQPPSGVLYSPTQQAPSLEQLGFVANTHWPQGVTPGEQAAQTALAHFCAGPLERYDQSRDFPTVAGTSRLSVHLRFGTISVRQAVRAALAGSMSGAATWLNELIWREFFMAVLALRPDVVDHCYRREYDALVWSDDDAAWAAWCAGQTGYPLVDAAQRELVATGFMHNRARMVSASFLVKDLGIDWRRGERFFARHLLDYDLAANNGGWQWSASTGCDAQPYFRIFNPVTQSQRFDPEGAYIRRWVPELAGLSNKGIHAPWLAAAADVQSAGLILGKDYPGPIVDHAIARQETLVRFKVVRG